MKLVILETPYAGNIERNTIYARQCVRDCLRKGESAIASHLLYTQENILDDSIPEERKLGIDAGHAWYKVAELAVIYVDYGISSGMEQGIKVAESLKVPVEYRWLFHSNSLLKTRP